MPESTSTGAPSLIVGVRLVILGSVENASLAKSLLSLGQNVVIISWDDDSWGYLSFIDVLCLPTLREGFPNVVLEAAAAGVPAITTRATGAVDSVQDKETGFLVNVGDAEAIARYWTVLRRDPHLKETLTKAAKTWVSREFQPEVVWKGIDFLLKGANDSSTIYTAL